VASMIAIHRWLKTWQKQIDIYIALTKFARDKYIEGGLPEKKIVIKPNFINSDPGMERKTKSYVLFAGRLSQEKGIAILLQAWKKLKGIPLKIAGDGLLKQKMEQFVRENNIQNVEFLGTVTHDKVIDLMKKAYCLALPSQWYECFSVTIIEAFACGTPVITFPLGAMLELIRPGETGVFLKSRDPQDIALCIEWAWKHPEQLERMGKMARLEYEIKYNAKNNYELLMEIYNKAIKVNNCNI
ncbi:MAG: glycosyltransferase family 4 protein, partial [Candidatus Omnitrophica bacterium]|nr:glycosyltransferase family 4 protein [Candidatus Omnitrophota bacterium]